MEGDNRRFKKVQEPISIKITQGIVGRQTAQRNYFNIALKTEYNDARKDCQKPLTI